MGNGENEKTFKSEKPSSPATLTTLTNPTNDHIYPDLAAIQAHYGPRVAILPYYNYQLGSAHAPHHYIWGAQQPIMAPYGTPYAAVYTHGNVYAHPALPVIAATPLNVEAPAKSSGNADKGLMKKLKSFDGLAMSLGNGGTESGAEDTTSHSVETGGSNNASDGNLAVANQMRRKRSREGTPTIGRYEKTETQVNPSSDRKVKQENGYAISPSMSKALEVNLIPINGRQASTDMPSELRSQNEKELNRERRKQSNRESARRSRLRKQAEAEELAQKVEFLSAENVSIKSEITQLAEKSQKLKLENASLLVRLGREELLVNSVDDKRDEAVCTENLLSRVDNSDSVDTNTEKGRENRRKISNPGAKLHQLLDSSLRTDGVTAS